MTFSVPKHEEQFLVPVRLEIERPGLSLGEIIGALRHHSLSILSAAVCGTLIGLIAAFTLTPIYRAEIVALPVQSRTGADLLGGLVSRIGDLGALAGIGLESTDSRKTEALAVLRSREFTYEFLTDEHLLRRLFEDTWDAGREQWKVDRWHAEPTLEDGFLFFDERVRHILEDRQSGLITLTIDWHDRHEAARWANQLIDRLNIRMRERAITDASKSIEYLTSQLEKTELVELRQSIFELLEAQMQSIMIARVHEEYAFTVVDRPTAPDEDKFVWPKRFLFVVFGFLFGGIGAYAFWILKARVPIKAECASATRLGGSPDPKPQ